MDRNRALQQAIAHFERLRRMKHGRFSNAIRYT
jgi:hypothetical protein